MLVRSPGYPDALTGGDEDAGAGGGGGDGGGEIGRLRRQWLGEDQEPVVQGRPDVLDDLLRDGAGGQLAALYRPLDYRRDQRGAPRGL